jgi:hypothetical protein
MNAKWFFITTLLLGLVVLIELSYIGSKASPTPAQPANVDRLAEQLATKLTRLHNRVMPLCSSYWKAQCEEINKTYYDDLAAIGEAKRSGNSELLRRYAQHIDKLEVSAAQWEEAKGSIDTIANKIAHCIERNGGSSGASQAQIAAAIDRCKAKDWN